MKRKTAKISELVERMLALKEDVGDIPVYVIQASDMPELNASVVFNGLSDNIQVLQVAQTGEQGLLVFQSDEILKP